MSQRKDYKKLLLEQAIKDKAENISIDNIEINRCENIKREMRIDFKCVCGEIDKKNIIRCLEKTGIFCKECTLKTGLDKMKATNIKNLGVENSFQSEEIKDKMKATNMKNLGVENPMQSKKIFEKCQKSLFKSKNRISIQKATTLKVLDAILNLI